MSYHLIFRQFICTLVIIAFTATMTPPLHAQEIFLPKPGVRVSLSPAFNPPVLKGLKVHPDNPFRFDFILDKGDLSSPNASVGDPELRQESTKLIKYFLASLTVPEKDLWVNLSPYEKDRIVPTSFGQTEMGRDLLAQDYLLKQITASLIYPEDEFGKTFWKRIYEEAAKKFGTTNIPVNTFNKVWIIPEKAVVYENVKAGTAYVVESKLKVMLEQDYLALEKNQPKTPTKDTNALGSQIVREIVIPQLTKEINENKNFAALRQVYNSLILATWYKKKIKDSILSKVYADKNKILGLTPTRGHVAGTASASNVSPSPWPTPQPLNAKAPQGNPPNDVEAIYQQYLKAFKKGVYNYIKEEQDPITQQMIPRKYFSGGFNLDMAMLQTTTDQAMLPQAALDHAAIVQTNLNPADQAMATSKNGPDGAMIGFVQTYSGKMFQGTTINALLGLKNTRGLIVSPKKAEELGVPILSGEFARAQGIPEENDTISVTPDFQTAESYALPTTHQYSIEKIISMRTEAQRELEESKERGYSSIDVRVMQTRADRLNKMFDAVSRLTDREKRELLENDVPIVFGFTDSVINRADGRDVDQRVAGVISVDEIARVYVQKDRKAQVEGIVRDLGIEHVKVITFDEAGADLRNVNAEHEEIYVADKILEDFLRKAGFDLNSLDESTKGELAFWFSQYKRKKLAREPLMPWIDGLNFKIMFGMIDTAKDAEQREAIRGQFRELDRIIERYFSSREETGRSTTAIRVGPDAAMAAAKGFNPSRRLLRFMAGIVMAGTLLAASPARPFAQSLQQPSMTQSARVQAPSITGFQIHGKPYDLVFDGFNDNQGVVTSAGQEVGHFDFFIYPSGQSVLRISGTFPEIDSLASHAHLFLVSRGRDKLNHIASTDETSVSSGDIFLDQGVWKLIGKYLSTGALTAEENSELVRETAVLFPGAVPEVFLRLDSSGEILGVNYSPFVFSTGPVNVLSTRFVPTDNKTVLLAGQQQDIIDDYVQRVGTPAGFMSYTSIQNVDGLTAPVDYGAGTQYAQDLVNRYPNTTLQVGLYMVNALDDVLSGRYDNNIRKLGEWIKQTRRPVYLRIGYEFDLPGNNYDPRKYKEAYQRIVTKLRAQGVTNVSFVWHSAVYADQKRPAQEWYPGDEYVDWVAMSRFNPSQDAQGARLAQWARQHNKPFMIAESSSMGLRTTRDKESFFNTLFQFIRANNVKVLGFINSNWDALAMFQNEGWGDQRLQSDPEILKLWMKKAVGDDSYLKSSPDLFPQLDFDPDAAMLGKAQQDNAMAAQDAGMFRDPDLGLSDRDAVFFEKLHGLVIRGNNNKRYELRFDEEKALKSWPHIDLSREAEFGVLGVGTGDSAPQKLGLIRISSRHPSSYYNSTGVFDLVLREVRLKVGDQGNGILSSFLKSLPPGEVEFNKMVNTRSLSLMLEAIIDQPGINDLLGQGTIEGMRQELDYLRQEGSMDSLSFQGNFDPNRIVALIREYVLAAEKDTKRSFKSLKELFVLTPLYKTLVNAELELKSVDFEWVAATDTVPAHWIMNSHAVKGAAAPQAGPDAAMLNKGGIDFNADKVNNAFAVQSNGGAIKFHIDPAMLEQLQNAPGFVPVIINIQPMTDLRMFLGLEQDKTAKERFTSL